jgi:hypothetical protein
MKLGLVFDCERRQVSVGCEVPRCPQLPKQTERDAGVSFTRMEQQYLWLLEPGLDTAARGIRGKGSRKNSRMRRDPHEAERNGPREPDGSRIAERRLPPLSCPGMGG